MWPGSGLNASLEKIPESSRQNGSTQSHFLEVTRHGGEGSHIPTWTWAPQVGFSHGRDWSQPSGARQGSWNPTGIRITGRTSLKCTPRPPKHEPGGQGGERECVSNYTLGRLLRLCRVATGITAPPPIVLFSNHKMKRQGSECLDGLPVFTQPVGSGVPSPWAPFRLCRP